MEDLVETSQDKPFLSILDSITEKDWKEGNWPIITSVPLKSYQNLIYGRNADLMDFWKEVFNPENFVEPTKYHEYNPADHVLCILHSFDLDGSECIFKAIATSPKMLREDVHNVLNYNAHGKPCELRSKRQYPTCNFRSDFYDRLKPMEQKKYPIPSRTLRERYIKEKFLSRR